MLADIDSGVPGIGLSAGDHICAFHFGPDERDLLIGLYLHAGLLAGDKCVAFIDDADPEALFDRLSESVDVAAALASHQLEVIDTHDSYLRNGGFSAAGTLSFLDTTVSAAVTDGLHPCARLLGEMSWVLRHPEASGELFSYESAVNEFSHRYPQVLLCLYDLEMFGPEMLVEALRTHPKLLLGGMLVPNPNYLTPGEYAALGDRPDD